MEALSPHPPAVTGVVVAESRYFTCSVFTARHLISFLNIRP